MSLENPVTSSFRLSLVFLRRPGTYEIPHKANTISKAVVFKRNIIREIILQLRKRKHVYFLFAVKTL